MGRTSPKTYSTREIARIAGVHPNTVRLYESWGFISCAGRAENNYRIFTEGHLAQMKLARAALPGPYPIDGRLVQGLVREFAHGNMDESLVLAGRYRDLVKREREMAVQALATLDNWYEKRSGDKTKTVIRGRRKAARQAGVSLDALRTWERNGLLTVSKDDRGVLAFSEWDLEKIGVIRLLRKCGYSIISLLRVFGRDEDLIGKPSVLLSLPDSNGDLFYATDMFMQYLEQHAERARRITAMIKSYKRRAGRRRNM